MAEPKDNIAMQPFVCSYCSDWPIHGYRIQTLLGRGWGVPVFILPFEMLLQLPEQKLHCHLVMALHLYSPHFHGAVRQQEHIHSRGSQRRCVPDLLCLVLLKHHSSLIKIREQTSFTGKHADVAA